MAKDAYYFSHDSNAKDDPKCMLLIEELQLEGYGIYWILVEVLREQENFKYPLKMIPVLARKFLTTKEKMLTVIEKYDLFVIENGEFFYSESLNRRMGLMNDKREKARLAGIKSGEARKNKALEYKEKINSSSTDDEQTFNERSTDDEQLKEKKVKEKKEINIYFDEFWKLYKGKKLLKVKCKEKWESLKDSDRELIIKHIPVYSKQFDVEFLKHAMTYLNSKMWLDDFEVNISKKELILTQEEDWRV